jgi:LVIVD repeat
MPKLLRILVPLVVLGAVLAIPTTASAQTATTCGAGGWAVDDPTSEYFVPGCELAPRENYEWLSSVVRSNTATQSDFAFKGDYVAAGNYAGFRIFDISDPTNPVLMSDTPCGGSQGDITIVGDFLFRSSDGSHNVPYGDLNRACETSGNENQRVTLTGFDTDGDSFQLRFNGNDTTPIIRGTNFTTAGIAEALAGRNEQQQVVLTNFNAATAGNAFRVRIGGQLSSLLGNGGTAISNNNVAAAINGIAGFAGTVTVSGAGNTGFTATFTAASGAMEIAELEIVFEGSEAMPPTGCTTAVTPCSATVTETVEHLPAVAGWAQGGTVTVSSLTDAGFNVTFAGTYAGSDVSMLSVVNGAPDVTGTVVEQLKGAPGVGFVGMYVFDISDVSNPEFITAVPVCGGGHTHTVYDDKARNRVVVYMTRSGTTGTVPGFGVSCAGLPSNRLTAVTVPKNNPEAARIASENIVYPGSGGCHDTNVFEEKKRILVACLGSGVSMLDISDPLNATVVWGPFTWPNHGTWHTGSWSWSGDYVYVNGEPGGGSASECAFDDHPAKPTVFALNADTGSLKGTWTLPRPQETTSATSNCTVHNLNVLPLANKNVLAHSFYTAGASIIDFTNPQAPKEVAFIDQILTPGGGPVIPSGAGCWSAYWYNGTIFCNELSWGLHLFDVDLPFWDDTMTLPAHNAQTVTNFIRCRVSFTGGPVRAGQTRTVRATARLYGPAPLQAAKDTNVRISGPGFNRLVKTNDAGVAQASVRAARAGRISVAVREADNLNITGGCSAPSRAIAARR